MKASKKILSMALAAVMLTATVSQTYASANGFIFEDTEAQPHEHSNTIIINEKAATCNESGYTGDVYCLDCDTVVEKGNSIPQLDHDWDEITYIWSDDLTQCTATKACKNDSKHNITETTEVIIKYVSPTCETDGEITYTAAFNNKSFYTQLQKQSIPAKNHPNAYLVRSVSATCTTDGYTVGTYCPDCEKYISGHEPIPAFDHSDSDGDNICDICGVQLNKDDGVTKETFINKIINFFKSIIERIKALFAR